MLVDTADNTQTKREARTRKLAGNPDTTDLTSASLVELINKGDQDVFLATNKSNWVSTDAEWENVINAAEHFAAARFWSGLGDQVSRGNASELIKEAKRIIMDINKKGPEQGTKDGTIVTYAPNYRTEPLSSRED